jgi:hypothetical protein
MTVVVGWQWASQGEVVKAQPSSRGVDVVERAVGGLGALMGHAREMGVPSIDLPLALPDP